MKLPWLFFAVSVLVPSVGQSAYYPELDVLKTPLGTVRVVEPVRSQPIDNSLTVNGKVVYRSGIGIGLYSQYKVADGIAVLFGENQGGNNWVWELSFLLLRPQHKPTIVTAKGFFSADATLEARQEGNDVVVDLGFEAKKRKTARLHAGEVLVRLDPVVPVIPVDTEICETLHKASAEDCIEYAKGGRSQCEKRGRNYSGGSVATMSDVTALSNHPGFSEVALGDVCVRECESGNAVSYDQFKKSVCSIK